MHVEVIPGVSAVGLVTNTKLCLVVWEIAIKNRCINIPVLYVSCCGRINIPNALMFCSVDREGSHRENN